MKDTTAAILSNYILDFRPFAIVHAGHKKEQSLNQNDCSKWLSKNIRFLKSEF